MVHCNRIAMNYSALIADAPVPPSFIGSLQDLIALETTYENSPYYDSDYNYWANHLPASQGSGTVAVTV